MLTNKQISEVRDHLRRAMNPLFLFDNDVDGLTAFLILQRSIGRGRGVAFKSMDLVKRRIEELGPDYIFVLDKPRIEKEFLDFVKEKGIPVVYIDHHPIRKPKLENYYNTYHASGFGEPTSYLCYNVVKRKEDMWLALLGCIADSYLPEFLFPYRQANPDLIDYDYETASDVRYNTVLGKVVQILNYGLKNTTTNVVKMLKFLMKAKGIRDILEENEGTRVFLERHNELKSLSDKLVEKAKKSIEGDVIFFTYGGKMSMSQDISDKLFYLYPDKRIVVGYKNSNLMRFSLRGEGIKKLTEKAIKKLEGANGGGHEVATGLQITADQVDKLKEIIVKG